MAAVTMKTPQAPQQLEIAAGRARAGDGAVEADEVKKIQKQTSNLAEAIFIPFSGFRSAPLSLEDPLSQGQKLAKIVENVENQQAMVKSNMIYLAGKRAGEVAAKAEAELTGMGEGYIDEEPRLAEGRRERRKEAEDLMQFMQLPAKSNAQSGDFTRRTDTSISTKPVHASEKGTPIRNRFANGDVKSGSPQHIHKTRTTYTVRKEATSDLQSIIMEGSAQLEAYDKLSSATLNYYKQAASRRTSKSNPPVPSPARARSGNVRPSPSPQLSPLSSPGHPRKNDMNIPSPVYGDLRRTSTGMPIVGSMISEPVRTRETIEELARRGGK